MTPWFSLFVLTPDVRSTDQTLFALAVGSLWVSLMAASTVWVTKT